MPMNVPLVSISVMLNPYFGEGKGPKTSQKGPFRGCWIGTQNFKNFNLATKNAILMKLTTISIFMRVSTEKHLELEIQIFGLIFSNL